MSNWTSSATTIMADSIANSAKYVQNLSSNVVSQPKNIPFPTMTPSVMRACKEGENAKRQSTIPSLYGATSDSLDTYDAAYDPISRSIFMIDCPVSETSTDPSKRARRRFTTDMTDSSSIIPNGDTNNKESGKIIPNNGVKRMSDLFSFSTMASTDKLK